MRAPLLSLRLLLGAATLGAATLLGSCAPDDRDTPGLPRQGTEQDGAGGIGGGSGEHEAEARLYGASSLIDVLGELALEFDRLGPGQVVASYAGSNTLAQQLREGAAPGVFISASVEWVDKLEGWGLVEPGSRVDLLSNSLVVIVPKDAQERPQELKDLADASFARISLADPTAVPAGKYAKAALEAAGIFEALAGKIVAAQDVRTALAYVERGEVPVGIVFTTDAAASSRVYVALPVPPEFHAKVVYPMVLVKGANRRAHELHEFLRSEQASAAFARAGFPKP